MTAPVHYISLCNREIIRRDMISFINNCVWPLSSYTPVTAVCCNLPELQEYSMEEIRHSAYSSGQLQTYVINNIINLLY